MFSPHTSLDATPNGINTFLVEPFIPISAQGVSEVLHPSSEKVAGFEGAGVGRRVDLGKPVAVNEVVKMVKQHLSLDHGQSSTPSLRFRHRASRILISG